MSDELPPRAGEVIGDRWLVIKKIGKGGFCTVYETVNTETSEVCALKCELWNAGRCEMVTKMEVAVLSKLRGVSKHVCAFMGCGRVEGRFHYIVMSLVGANLDDLRRRLVERHFEPYTVVRLAIQCIECIRDVHEAGFVHRDIKPGNFAFGQSDADQRTLHILDFGLARRYLLNDPDEPDQVHVRPARESVGFRGTLRYCSIRAHHNAEIGRQDDLWSLFYSLIELRAGSLPWRTITDNSALAQKKKNCHVTEMVPGMKDAEIFVPFERQLRRLRYEDKPNYEWFIDHFVHVQKSRDYQTDGPFEWEEESEEETASDSDDSSCSTAHLSAC